MAGDPLVGEFSGGLGSGFNPRPPSMAGDPRLDAGCAFDVAGFNPRPPSMAGDPGLVRTAAAGEDVSIRARHRWRAIHHQFVSKESFMSGFNPRPPSMAGDPHSGHAAGHHRRCFNPRPPSMAGDPTAAAPRRPKTCRFNPRPPSMAGDPHRCGAAGHELAVSIRARHRWRAIPSWAVKSPWLSVFQSAPAIDGGRSSLRVDVAAPRVMFQSAPAIDGGRS